MRHEKKSCKRKFSNEIERFQCENCGKIFSSEHNVTRHEKKSCKSSLAQFPLSTSLVKIEPQVQTTDDQSEDQNEDQSEEQIEDENKSCKEVNNEEKVSNKTKRFPCENCDLTFSTSSHLSRHQKKIMQK